MMSSSSDSAAVAVAVADDDKFSTNTIEDINKVLIPRLLEQLSGALTFLNSNNNNNSLNESNNSKSDESNNGGSGTTSSSSKSGNEIGKNLNKNKNKNKNKNESKKEGSRSLSLHHQHLYLYGQLDKLRRDLNYVKESFEELRRYEDNVTNPFKEVELRVEAIVKDVQGGSTSLPRTNLKLRELSKIVTNLKLHVPSAAAAGHKMSSSSSSSAKSSVAQGGRVPRSDPLKIISNGGLDADDMFDGLPSMFMNKRFRRSAGFNDIKQAYNGLSFKLKLCLLCFSIFPENEMVQRRVLMYWWIGEGLIVPPPPPSTSTSTREKKTTVEDVADNILQELMTKGFIEPVHKKRRLVADGFKMHPFIRSVLILLGKEAELFDFDREGNPTANFELSHRAFLTQEGSSFRLSTNSYAQSNQDPEQLKLYTLFNVNEQYLKLEPDWFAKLKNVSVLQLGRWQSSAKHHIEAEDTEFLKRLKNLRHVMFLSLQGISRIMELPDTIGSLINLRILDLRACHNLEVLPEGIALLKKLTHLDMSECYLLDNMPKGIASLTELQVLKGFVISDLNSINPCTLFDLIKLNSLRKLSIRTGSEAFPRDKEVEALQQFKALRKLTMAWGGSSIEKSVAANTTLQDNKGNNTKEDNHAAAPATQTTTKSRPIRALSKIPTFKKDKPTDPENLALPTSLEKLDLQCFPHRKRPSWLKPKKLTGLEKLYIRGGTLSNLCEKNDQWTSVQILRLKYLYELKMDWTELHASFPNLKYLEKVKCSKLTFCPCNERGVWQK